MNIRKLTSVGLAAAAIVVILTGVAIYFNIGPHQYMKTAHNAFSVTFITFTVIHMVLNFTPLRKYLTAKRELAVNICILAISSAITVIAILNAPKVSVAELPPVNRISLAAVLEAVDVNYDTALATLADKGMIIPDGKLTIAAISAANNINPKVVYGTIISNAAHSSIIE